MNLQIILQYIHVLDHNEGIAYTGMFLWLLHEKESWTLYPHGPDHAQICPIDNQNVIKYSKPDKVLMFDHLISVALTAWYTNHEQCLQVKTSSIHHWKHAFLLDTC